VQNKFRLYIVVWHNRIIALYIAVYLLGGHIEYVSFIVVIVISGVVSVITASVTVSVLATLTLLYGSCCNGNVNLCDGKFVVVYQQNKLPVSHHTA